MTYYKEGLDLPAQVGNYLRSERKKRKMTQERFAELANVDVRTVRSWEKGQFYSFGPLETILFTFQVSIGDVFSNGEDVPSHNFKNEKRTYRMNAIRYSRRTITQLFDVVNKHCHIKTVQYLAGHEKSKTTLDIYAHLAYNKPEDTIIKVRRAFDTDTKPPS